MRLRAWIASTKSGPPDQAGKKRRGMSKKASLAHLLNDARFAADPNQRTTLMEYMLIHLETTKEVARKEDPKEAPAYWGAWEGLRSGALRVGHREERQRSATAAHGDHAPYGRG